MVYLVLAIVHLCDIKNIFVDFCHVSLKDGLRCKSILLFFQKSSISKSRRFLTVFTRDM